MTNSKRFISLSLLCCSILLLACENKKGDEPSLYKANVHEELSLIDTDVKMVPIKGGFYKPFYGDDTVFLEIKPFMIDEHPVTNADFLKFVKANPKWRKSNIKKLYSDENYLLTWVNDTTFATNAKPDAPITQISWFAAKAYANSVQKRLPTLDEWEFVAMANEIMPNARKQKSYSDDIVDLYLVKDRQFISVRQSAPNYYGVYNLFDLIWEWTDDFNSVLTTGDSREGSYDSKGLFCAGAATGATDLLNYAAFMRFGFRASLKADYTVSNLGFRCASDITTEAK